MTPQEKAVAYTAAWNSKEPHAVAAHFTPDASIVINSGDPHQGSVALSAMAAGFHAEFPYLSLISDDMRAAGFHAVYRWTLEGRHAKTGNFVRAHGWEEWDLDTDMQITRSLGWFDADAYRRQIDGTA